MEIDDVILSVSGGLSATLTPMSSKGEATLTAYRSNRDGANSTFPYTFDFDLI